MKQKTTKNSKNSGKLVDNKLDLPIEILGVAISGTKRDRVLKKIWLQRKEMLHIATVNPEFVMEAQTNEKFKKCLTQALTVADGWGIVWGLRLAQGRLVERISGSGLAETMVEHAAVNGEKIFLLGAAEGVAERAAAVLRTKYPQLQISWYSGAQTVKLEKDEEASMTIAKINAYEPDYLLVAYGSPWQDIWIEDNRPYLRVRVAMGVGGVFDEWAGVVRRCPDWIDQLGLKWMYRLLTQPWRARRVLRVIQFGFIVLFMRLKRLF